jgi:hypothetical protein
MEKALEHLTKNIQEYRSMEVLEGNRLNVLLQQITGTLFYLEGKRSDYYQAWTANVNSLILEGNSVARSTTQADEYIPELYMLRKIMSSAYEVVGAIRSNISWLKTERINTTN